MVSFILLGRKGGTSMVRKYRLTKKIEEEMAPGDLKRGTAA